MESIVEEGLRFIERCAEANAEAATSDFLKTVDHMGFDGTACGAWAGVGKNRRSRFFFVQWPADWLEFYNTSGAFEVDLLPLEARRRVTPFLWSEIYSGKKLTAAQKAFSEAGWAYGWRDVFAVPIHGPGNLQGLVTLATRTERVFDAKERAVLEIMARTIWDRCRTTEGFGMPASGSSKLSARELECLQWAAAGKSDADIAELIGISRATAHFHIERAKRRLGVKTRVEAVAVGVLEGLI
jgi:DNA-binding CsgD family transcriptional regulator